MAAIVVLDVFSGRPNPTWRLSDQQETEFARRVASAPPATASSGVPGEPLGYHGFRVRVDGPAKQSLEFRIFRGWILDAQTRADPGRALERWLLTTAQGSIPADLAAYIGGEINTRP
jgi:hypothetical protein